MPKLNYKKDAKTEDTQITETTETTLVTVESQEKFDLTALPSLPQNQGLSAFANIPEREATTGAPYIMFFDGRSGKAADILAKYPETNPGDPFVMVDGDAIRWEPHWKFTILAAKAYWCNMDAQYSPINVVFEDPEDSSI